MKDAFLIILAVIVLGGNVLSKRECLKKILIYSYCYGVVAHGIMMFNKISWHDDLAFGRLLSFDAATGLGRWFRAVLAYVVALVTNGTNLSLPLFHGLLSIFFIALSVFILIQIFHIENVWLQSVLCGLFVTYPVVTSTFAYMFTAPYYFFALFLAVFAVYFELTHNNKLSFAVSSVCICLSLGTYQAYFSVAVSCFVIILITGIVDDNLESVKSIFLRGIRYLSICVCGLVEYYIIWKLFLKVFNISASDYQGLSSIGGAGIENYIKGIQKAYFAFFQLLKNTSPNDINCDLFPMRGARFLEWIVILTCVGISLILILRVIRKNIYKGLLLACLVGLLPLCFNLIFLMSATSPNSQIHTLMLYAGSMLYVYCIWLLQYIVRGKFELAHNVYRLSAVLMSLLLIMNVYFANACYLKAEILQQRTLSEMTVLVTRIKSVEQYNDEMPVSFVIAENIDSTRTANYIFADLAIIPYDNWLTNPFNMKRNMVNSLSIWCGFSPQYVDSGRFASMQEVQEMPCYPDDGSIRIIDNTVVVKM